MASLADSLSRLIEHTPDMKRIPVTLVDQHVDAIRAIIRESARPDIVSIADTLTRRLREAQPGLPVLFMSGHSESGVLEGDPLAPGAAFLQKPFKPADLIEALEQLLGDIDSSPTLRPPETVKPA